MGGKGPTGLLPCKAPPQFHAPKFRVRPQVQPRASPWAKIHELPTIVMEVVVAEPCDAAADEAVPAGWRCANPECRAATASKRRGPSKEFCSKNKCKELAALASAALKEDAKDRRIAKLEKRVLEQATTIALLKHELARAQAAPIHHVAAPSAAPAGTCRPLAALSLNAQQPAQPPAKKVKPSGPPLRPPAVDAGADAPGASAWEPSAEAWEGCGWSARPSRSRPGESRWVHKELGLKLDEAPTLHKGDAGWQVQLPLVKAIIESFFFTEHGPIPPDELYADFEACVPLKEGAVSGSKSLRRALRAACEQAGKQIEEEWADECHALCAWLEGATAPEGRSVRDAVAALGWPEHRVRGVAACLARGAG